MSKETYYGAKVTYNVRTFDLTYAGGVMKTTSVKIDLL
jgi:hypothetical protein